MLPRRYVLIPILVSGILMGMTQRIYIFSLDFTPVRILLLCGWIRLIIRSEYRSVISFNNIDKIFCLYVLWTIIAYVILWFTMDALIYKLGFLSYSFGIYFLVRYYIKDIDDLEKIINTLLYFTIPIAIVVIIERTTQHNYFSVFGNVDSYTYIREGKVRCFGPFSHPITLGSFGAALMPLSFSLLWKKKGNKNLGLVSLLASITMVFSSSSSGPFIALAASISGLFMWNFRKFLRVFLWGFFISIIGLHFIMKAPVWALINRLKIFSSSSTYHRFLIIDRLIANFNEWWLIGIQSTKHWVDWKDITDVSNNYARVAVDGGIFVLALFVAVIILCFRHVGRMIVLAHDNLDHQKLFWSLGVCMFSYVVSFLGVSLWDQTILIWYFIIALLASIKYKSIKV
jgi:hypothetical protein